MIKQQRTYHPESLLATEIPYHSKQNKHVGTVIRTTLHSPSTRFCALSQTERVCVVCLINDEKY